MTATPVTLTSGRSPQRVAQSIARSRARRPGLADTVRAGATGALLPYRAAFDAWAEFRTASGMPTAEAPITSAPSSSTKVRKSMAAGHPATWSLTLAPARSAGVGDACPSAVAAGCLAPCLQSSGRLGMDRARRARIVRTQFLAAAPDAALSLVWWEVLRGALSTGGPVGFRPNVLSDLPWEDLAPWWWDAWRDAGADVRTYDYTKLLHRDPRPAVARGRYRLTYSASAATSDADIAAMVADGRNVATVFDYAEGLRPGPRARWNGLRVIDGETSDYRYADRAGAVVALYAKGDARGTGAAGGFVRPAVDSLALVTR